MTELKINLSNQNDALAILSNLPNLVYLNGKSTREETGGVDIDEKDIDSFSLNNEIENFNVLIDNLLYKYYILYQPYIEYIQPHKRKTETLWETRLVRFL